MIMGNGVMRFRGGGCRRGRVRVRTRERLRRRRGGGGLGLCLSSHGSRLRELVRAAAGAAVVAIAVALRGEWWGLFDVLHVMVVGVVLVAKGGLRGETFS